LEACLEYYLADAKIIDIGGRAPCVFWFTTAERKKGNQIALTAVWVERSNLL